MIASFMGVASLVSRGGLKVNKLLVYVSLPLFALGILLSYRRAPYLAC